MILNQLIHSTKRTIREVVLPLALSLTPIYALRCTGGESQQPKGIGESCATDNECLDNLVCDYGRCAPYTTNGRGDGTPSVSPRTPEETFSGLVEAFTENNLEAALKYFAPHMRETYRNVLSRKSLPELAKLMEKKNLSPSVSSNKFVQYEVEINGEEYAITFNCVRNHCYVIGF